MWLANHNFGGELLKITESNVVEHIRNKNEKAIAFIVEQYGGLLTAIIKRHLHTDQQDYEECLDDVLLAVWQHIHSFDPEKNSFKQWIAAIAKYKAIDYQRKQIRLQNRQFSVAEFNEKLSPRQTSGAEMVSVEELLKPLSASEQQVFKKYYLEGVPANEIANELQVKRSWIYNKLSRGRKKLKKFFVQNHKV